MTSAPIAKPDLAPLPSGLGTQLSPSHLILNVADTDATIRFYRGVFGAGVERDMEIESPALDAMFGRSGVRIRSTFIDVGGYRLHTIEALDVPRTSRPASMGLTGLSFAVPDLEAARQMAIDAGYRADAELRRRPRRPALQRQDVLHRRPRRRRLRTRRVPTAHVKRQ